MNRESRSILVLILIVFFIFACSTSESPEAMKACPDIDSNLSESENAEAFFENGCSAQEAYAKLSAFYQLDVDETVVLLKMTHYLNEEVMDASLQDYINKYSELIEAYGPIFNFHHLESYLPSSVEWFLENSYLEDDTGYSGSVTPNELMMVVEQQKTQNNASKFWFRSNGIKEGDLQNATSYVHVYRTEIFTDIQFWLFYPYNGPGSIKSRFGDIWSSPIEFGNLAPLGEHVGDWEVVILRFDNNNELLGAFLSSHGDYPFYDKQDIDMNNNQALVYASLNGHGNYPRVGDNTDRKLHLGLGTDVPVLGYVGGHLDIDLLNVTSNQGQQFNAAQNYRIIAIDDVTFGGTWTEPLNDMDSGHWINFDGRWGESNMLSLERGALADLTMDLLGPFFPSTSAIVYPLCDTFDSFFTPGFVIDGCRAALNPLFTIAAYGMEPFSDDIVDLFYDRESSGPVTPKCKAADVWIYETNPNEGSLPPQC